MEQLTEKQAIAIAESGVWKKWFDEEVVKLQLFQDRLCMDFDRFHSAIEKVLKRSVFTHEFMSFDNLQKEYLGEKKAPTLDEILVMIPETKRIVVVMNKWKATT